MSLNVPEVMGHLIREGLNGHIELTAHFVLRLFDFILALEPLSVKTGCSQGPFRKCIRNAEAETCQLLASGEVHSGFRFALKHRSILYWRKYFLFRRSVDLDDWLRLRDRRHNIWHYWLRLVSIESIWRVWLDFLTLWDIIVQNGIEDLFLLLSEWIHLASLVTFPLGLIFDFFLGVIDILVILSRGPHIVELSWGLSAWIEGGGDWYGLDVFTCWMWTGRAARWSLRLLRIVTGVHLEDFLSLF